MQRFILERYLIRESLQNALAVIAVLMLIYVSNRFVRYLAEAAAGDLDSGVILELLLLKLVSSVVVLLPLSLYLGVLLAMGRLYRDSEVVAMHAGGVGMGHLLRGVGTLGLLFAAAVSGLSLVMAPLAAERAAELTVQARNDSEVTGLYPGRFRDFGAGDHIIYVQDIAANRSQMRDVFVQVRRGADLDIVNAESAYQFIESRTGDRFMVLENGYRYEGAPGSADFVVHRFERHGVRIRQRDEGAAYRRLETMTLGELLDGDEHTHQAELQWRVSLPLSALLLSVLAVPLARTSPRSGKYGKLFTAVLIYFIYSNFTTVAQKAVERGDLDPHIGVWPVHAALALAIAAMLFSMSGGLGRLRMARLARR